MGDDTEHVAAAILRNGETILLCHRHPQRRWYPNVWDLPGGHIEPGETAPAALVRELHEELGVAIAEPQSGPFTTLSAVGVEIVVWLIDYDGGVNNRAPEEHDELRWFRREEIAHLALAHPRYINMLSRAFAINGTVAF